MNGWAFFGLYMPVKLHFTGNYDIFKYNGGGINTSEESFNIRRDRNRFELYGAKLKSHKTAGYFCVANFVRNDNPDWFYHVTYDEADAVYMKWLKYRQSYAYMFGEDLKTILDTIKKTGVEFESVTRHTKSGRKPPLSQMLTMGYIQPETVLLIDQKLGFLDNWLNTKYHDPYLIEQVKKLKKYSPFIKDSVFDPEITTAKLKEICNV